MDAASVLAADRPTTAVVPFWEKVVKLTPQIVPLTVQKSESLQQSSDEVEDRAGQVASAANATFQTPDFLLYLISVPHPLTGSVRPHLNGVQDYKYPEIRK